MSDNDASKTAMQIASSLATDVYKDGLQPSVKSIGEALAGIFKAVGHYPRYWGMMSDISLEHKQQQFKDKLEAKVAAIPDDKKILPKPNILGPSIQALEYGIFEDHLSEMFANLLAGSMNSDLALKIHPSFVEIIKQLTSDEAKMLKYISSGGLMPLVEIRRATGAEGVFTVVEAKYHLCALAAGCESSDRRKEMTENLERLKLIDVSDDESRGSISDKSVYVPLRQHAEANLGINIREIGDRSTKLIGQNFLALGYLQISAYGRQFVEVCSS